MKLFILALIIIFIINNIWLFVYCRIAEKLNRREEEYKQSLYNNEENESADITHNNAADASLPKNISVKKLISKLYYSLNPYFYGWMRYCVLLTGKIPSNRIRKLFYRFIFNMKITANTAIGGGCEFRSPWNIHADRCVIQANCIFDGRSSIYIENNVVFGTGVHIWTQEHDVNDPYFAVNEQNAKAVYIKEYAWVCSDSTILPGVVIGKGAVLASRAVATKDCSDYGIYGGVPAKKIGERTHDLRYKTGGRPHWHFY